MANPNPREISPVRLTSGSTLYLELPASEVCMHMRIAGQTRLVELFSEQVVTNNGPRLNFMARIYLDNGYTIVLPGEAGIYTDDEGFYAYPAQEANER